MLVWSSTEPSGASNASTKSTRRAWPGCGPGLDRFWSKTLAAYKAVVEQPPKGDPDEHRMQRPRPCGQSIVVEAPIARAFKVFTERVRELQTPEHNMLGVEIAETVFEPRVGGHTLRPRC